MNGRYNNNTRIYNNNKYRNRYALYIHWMVKNEDLMEWMAKKMGMPPHTQAYIDMQETIQQEEEDEKERGLCAFAFEVVRVSTSTFLKLTKKIGFG